MHALPPGRWATGNGSAVLAQRGRRSTASRPPHGRDQLHHRGSARPAFRLVHQSYVGAGLSESNRYGMRVTPYHLLSTTETFIAVCDGLVISTVSLVIDGELGLPMESIHAREVAARRARGLLVGEVSCLADRRRDFKRLFPVFIRLCRAMGRYARLTASTSCWWPFIRGMRGSTSDSWLSSRSAKRLPIPRCATTPQLR
jgi:hypothetical protein